MIIDTHAHLMFDQFKGEVPEILKRAGEAGVGKIINVSCSVESSFQAADMVEKYGAGAGKSGVSAGVSAGAHGVELFATVGLHPYDVLDLSDDLLDKWTGLIGGSLVKKIVAVGEIGLDYFKSKVPKEDQKAGFRRQLQFAERVGLPVIVHNREADEDTFGILREYPKIRAVFHCYGSSLEFARKLWDRDYCTSFTGVITYPGASVLREVVKQAPDWTLMVETDCPFLAPQTVDGVGMRGQRNEPSYVVEVLREIARLRRQDGRGFSEIEALQERNVREFYGI